MTLVDEAFRELAAELWTETNEGVPQLPPPPRTGALTLTEVRERMRLGLCPGCGQLRDSPRKTMCELCRPHHSYCPRCEAVAPLSEFWRPSRWRANLGMVVGEHKTCYPSHARLTAEERAEASRASVAAHHERWRAHGARRRAAVVAAVEAAGGVPRRGKRAWWDEIGKPLGITGYTAEGHYRNAMKGRV